MYFFFNVPFETVTSCSILYPKQSFAKLPLTLLIPIPVNKFTVAVFFSSLTISQKIKIVVLFVSKETHLQTPFFCISVKFHVNCFVQNSSFSSKLPWCNMSRTIRPSMFPDNNAFIIRLGEL